MNIFYIVRYRNGSDKLLLYRLEKHLQGTLAFEIFWRDHAPQYRLEKD